MKKHVIVVSIDAMVFEDLDYAKTLPNFKRILKDSSIIKRVKTIYPSVTHPVHATLITGSPAGVTSVVNNIVFDKDNPQESRYWYNFMNQIKCDTILHAAKRNGLTTATACWPLTSKPDGVIDYFVPCALNIDFCGFEDNPIDAYRALGATDSVIPIIEEGIKLYGWKDVHPAIDEFQTYCASEIIKKYKPNLLLTHPSFVDSKRHRGGVFGENVYEALRATDEWLGKLLSATETAGIYEDCDFVLLSDHGQINVSRILSPNVFLADKGFIKLDEEGKVLTYDAFAKSTGASAQVYLSRPDDKALYNEVYTLLKNMADEGIYGFERVFTTEETKELYGLYGDFSFVLETDGYTSFSEQCVRPVVKSYNFSDYRLSKGTHGHMPEKGPQPLFVASGPSFKSGVEIETGSVLNHAPTIAKVLGIEIDGAVGKPVLELLK